MALSAPGATGFSVPYTFSLAAAGPLLQIAGASEWGVGLQGGKVCPSDSLLILWGLHTHAGVRGVSRSVLTRAYHNHFILR